MATPFVTIEETEEELIVCLHLPLSETSPAQRSSASSAIQSLTDQLSETGSPPPIGSTEEPPSPSVRLARPFGVSLGDLSQGRGRLRTPDPELLDVGLFQPRRGPGKETIIAELDRAIAANKAPVGGVIGGLSRGIGNLLFGTGIDPRSGVSISQQLAELTGTSVAEVHLRLLLPFIGEPGLGKDFARAMVNDFRTAARNGDVEALEGTIRVLAGAETRIQGIIRSQTSVGAVASDPGAGASRGTQAMAAAGRGILVIRSDRALKGVQDLKRQAELNLLLAERVQEDPRG